MSKSNHWISKCDFISDEPGNYERAHTVASHVVYGRRNYFKNTQWGPSGHPAHLYGYSRAGYKKAWNADYRRWCSRELLRDDQNEFQFPRITRVTSARDAW